MELGLIGKFSMQITYKSKLDQIILNRSLEWNSVSEKFKKEIGLVIDGDGEFWYLIDFFNFTL